MKYPVSISLFCLLVLLPFHSESKLLVRGPSSIKEQFDAYNGLDYYVVTPKDAPKNIRFVGNLVLSNPITGCSDISSSTPELFEVQNPILVMQKGDCAFPQKAQNAEVAGAKMVIIISDHDLAPNHQIEREYQYPVGIETVIVSKTDGEKLLSYLQTETEDPLYNEPIEIAYSVNVDRHINYQKKSQNVMIDYWFASADFNGDSYKTLRVLKEILEEFGDRVTFNPHYVLWQASSESDGFNQPDPRCISGGRYCDSEPLTDSPLSGSKGVMETLRQICLRSFESKVSLGGFWWTYVKKLINYSEVCGNDQFEGMSCYEATRMITGEDMLANNVKGMVDQCVRESFGGIDASQYNGGLELAVDNTLLSKELELQTQTGLVHYPSIYVNDRRYMEVFSSKDAIKDFICGHFEDGYVPVACTKTTLYSVAPGNNSSGSFLTYFLMILGCCVFMVVLVYCVRRSVKRQIMKEMDHEVSAIISQYAQLKDQQKPEEQI